MRRRNLLENAAKLTLSIQTITVEPSASTFTFYAMWNGTKIASSSTLSVTYDGTVISGRSIDSNGTITAKSSKYTGTSVDRSGYLEVTYSGQTARVEVTQKKDYVASTSSTNSTQVVSIYSISSVNSLSFYSTYSSLCNSSDIVLDISYYGQYRYKRDTYYYDNYASGRSIQTNTTTSYGISAYGNYTERENMGVTPNNLYYNVEGHILSKSIGEKSFLIDGTSLSLDDKYHEWVIGTLYGSCDDVSTSISINMCF